MPETTTAMQPKAFELHNLTYHLLFGLVLLLAVILPRFAAIGDYISMDEGYHAFMTAYIHQSYASGAGFPAEMSGYKLYPFITFWLANLPGNLLVWLRVADLLAAIAMGYVFCNMLMEESHNRLAGLLLAFSFLIGLNYAGAINNGFKNSFFPAFLCLCGAVNLARGCQPSSPRWFLAGALTAIAILFRETFVLFPIIGVIGLAFDKNYKAMFGFIAGGLGAALFITLILALLRGQLWKIFEFYFVYGKIYGPEAAKRLTKFIQNGGRALLVYSPLLIIAFISLIPVWRQRHAAPSSRAIFWLSCALAPLLEPYLKIGFLYHFSACLPGLAGLCAYGFGKIPPNDSSLTYKYYWAFLICAFVMLPYTIYQYVKWPTSLETLKTFPASTWPEALASHSTTLEAARKIQQSLPVGGTVASSGFAYFIFPASGAFPPRIALGDLSRTYIYAHENASDFNREIAKTPPDIVLLAKAAADHSETFHTQLKDIFDSNPDYEFMDSVEPDGRPNYGWLGYDIYRKKNPDASR